jgi:hypothetical protein
LQILQIWFGKVVATIHQPSSRLLDHFDNLYIMSKGSCIYQGPTGSLISYLKKFNLNCPSYHNPADFGEQRFICLVNSNKFENTFFLILGKFPNIIACFLFPVMDVATGEYGDVLFQLTSGVENGRLIYNEFSESILATSSQDGNSVS